MVAHQTQQAVSVTLAAALPLFCLFTHMSSVSRQCDLVSNKRKRSGV
jgi:hypothetical protein